MNVAHIVPRNTLLGLSGVPHTLLLNRALCRSSFQLLPRRGHKTVKPDDPFTTEKAFLRSLWESSSLKCWRSDRIGAQSDRGGRHEWAVTHENELTGELKKANDFFLDRPPSLLYTAYAISDHPLNSYVPEVAIFGASNSGKSSLVNALVKKRLAHEGHRPGKTKSLNAYGVGTPLILPSGTVLERNEKAPNHSLILVDTPGYGYQSRKDWGEHVRKYVRLRQALRGAIVVIRMKAGIKGHDIMTLDFLRSMNIPTQIVVTMADKVQHGWLGRADDIYKELQRTFNRRIPGGALDAEPFGGYAPEIYWTASSFDGKHKDKLKLKANSRGDNAGIAGARLAVMGLAGLLNDEAFEEVRRKRMAVLAAAENRKREAEKHRIMSAQVVLPGEPETQKLDRPIQPSLQKAGRHAKHR